MYPILAIRRALCRGDIFTLVRAHGAQQSTGWCWCWCWCWGPLYSYSRWWLQCPDHGASKRRHPAHTRYIYTLYLH